MGPALLVISVLLSGCASTQDMMVPQGGAPVDMALNDGSPAHGEMSDAAARAAEAPASMASAVNAALNYSAATRAAGTNLELAGIDADIARSGMLPTLQGSAGLNTDNQGQMKLTLTQTLVDWGATSADTSRAETEQTAAEFTLAAEQERVALEAAQSYIDVKRAAQLVRAAQDNLAVYDRFTDLAAVRAQGGVSDASEGEMAAIHRGEAEAGLEDALGVMRNARSVYASRIGAAPGQLAEVPDLALTIGGIADMRAAAMQAPETAAVLAQGEAAEFAVAARQASLLPKLTAEAYVSSDYSLERPDMGLAVRLASPIYAGLRNFQEVEAARLAAESANWTAEDTIRRSVQQVQAFRDRAPTLQNRLRILTQQRERALSLRGLYEDQFKLGQRALPDLVTVQSDIYRIERSLIEARYAIYDLQYAAAAALGKLRETLAGAA